VIIFDPNWNPSFDLQAQDRAFRLGQQSFVSIYRLISVRNLQPPACLPACLPACDKPSVAAHSNATMLVTVPVR
jgi:hypothetical protein